MKYPFYKYQGAGNDFVIFDNRNNQLKKDNPDLYNRLCDRKFGIGADGLMLLQNHPEYDFEMIYFNADGSESTMCGNGGRCLVAFAKELGMVQNDTKFLAVDGPHYAKISGEIIHLQMIDVNTYQRIGEDYTLNTGSPHYIKFMDDLQSFDVYTEGRAIRNSPAYAKEGINVNFVEEKKDGIFVRTFERGVENETLSCGTGVTAAAIAYALKNKLHGEQSIAVKTLGGNLKVSFERKGDSFSNIFLIGPAEFVFSGSIDL
jgi:diaminopimelate epimerase